MLTPAVTAIAEIRAAVADARKRGLTVALVPTMGALHDGHAALVRAAKRDSGFVVVSVFVNPTQFGPNEDFAKYPRTLEADQKVCHDAGADVIFAPTAAEMYPREPVTFVEVTKLQDELCGPLRPGHFRGVCTVVLKLFNIVGPDVAHFGAKDFQQALVIRTMVDELNVPVRVKVEPTVREPDGLAMSSRNRYLPPELRAVAPRIYEALRAVQKRAAAGEVDVARLESALFADLEAIPGARVQYARVVDSQTLQPVSRLVRPAVAAVAVYLGTTRLIDNVMVP